jgi:tetraacyldisaccharide 4'-kinase
MILKKPLFWDQKKQSFLSIIFYPLTFLTLLSNFYLDSSIKKRNKKIFSICLGNIYIGGTGKTPLAIKIYQLLSKTNKNIIIGKKYYSEHKDEILLLKEKASLLVEKDRKKILQKAINKQKKIIIFDDGLQDKELSYDLKFVCFDSSNWIGNGNLIPAGPLRESLKSLKKFDAVFLKNSLKPNNRIIKKIKQINPKIKIFNTRYKIKNLNEFNLKNQYLIFSGIGNPNSFLDLLKNNKFIIKHQIIFPDHFNYLDRDIKEIIKKSKKLDIKILTTEKDYVKLSKKYHKLIKCIKVDLIVEEQKKLINFLNEKI